MDKLRAMHLFVRLADLGSFTRVAEQTHYSKSMISKEISRLEESLNARLLHRSTRKVQLTHIGEGYLQRAREILEKLDEADHFAQELRQRPQGKLKINAPMALGITDLANLFADFMMSYPEVELDIHLGDESIDLVEQGFDLGFRASSRPVDSAYVGRPLTQFNYKVCVAADYFCHHAKITKPSDLEQHNCFEYSYFQGKSLWPIDAGVNISGKLKVNSTIFMLEAIKRGQGIGFIPDFVCKEAIEKGEIMEILNEADKPKLTLYALYPARHFVPSILGHCVDYLEQWFVNR